MRRAAMWLLLLSLPMLGCRRGRERFPYGEGYVFVDQNGKEVRLDTFRGKTVVITYFYTHCPDACPLTMTNMKRLYARLPDSLMDRVVFVAVSIDPERDRPEVLREYARLYRIDFPNWFFLTGRPEEIRRFLREVGVIAVKGKTTITPRGDTVYFLTHTDYVHVVSPDGRIVYRGDGERLNIGKAYERITSSLP